MNNKSFYAIISFVALVGLLIVGREASTVRMIMHILLCGGAFYYVVATYQRIKRITFLIVVMALVGLLFNPLYLFPLTPPQWIVAYIVAMFLFYIIARKTPLNENLTKTYQADDNDETKA